MGAPTGSLLPRSRAVTLGTTAKTARAPPTWSQSQPAWVSSAPKTIWRYTAAAAAKATRRTAGSAPRRGTAAARDVRSAMAESSAKNAWARLPWAIASVSSRSTTRSPPSTPCATTVAAAVTPSHLRRPPAGQRATARPSVSRPTTAPASRWLCS